MPCLSERLMIIAARISVETPFGWSHPDCETLVEAAGIVDDASLGYDLTPIGVLSETAVSELSGDYNPFTTALDDPRNMKAIAEIEKCWDKG